MHVLSDDLTLACELLTVVQESSPHFSHVHDGNCWDLESTSQILRAGQVVHEAQMATSMESGLTIIIEV